MVAGRQENMPGEHLTHSDCRRACTLSLPSERTRVRWCAGWAQGAPETKYSGCGHNHTHTRVQDDTPPHTLPTARDARMPAPYFTMLRVPLWAFSALMTTGTAARVPTTGERWEVMPDRVASAGMTT